MKIEINNVSDGGYGLRSNHNLYFNFDGENELILDKKSAFEIAYTLIYSLDLMDYDVQEFFYKVQDILNSTQTNENMSKNDFDSEDI